MTGGNRFWVTLSKWKTEEEESPGLGVLTTELQKEEGNDAGSRTPYSSMRSEREPSHRERPLGPAIWRKRRGGSVLRTKRILGGFSSNAES